MNLKGPLNQVNGDNNAAVRILGHEDSLDSVQAPSTDPNPLANAKKRKFAK